MDGITLLREAQEVGLSVSVSPEGKLIIRGPRTEESLARRLLASKAEVLSALGFTLNVSVCKTQTSPIPKETGVSQTRPPVLPRRWANRVRRFLEAETDPDWRWYGEQIAPEGRLPLPPNE
jgi:hypothetical protein